MRLNIQNAFQYILLNSCCRFMCPCAYILNMHNVQESSVFLTALPLYSINSLECIPSWVSTGFYRSPKRTSFFQTIILFLQSLYFYYPVALSALNLVSSSPSPFHVDSGRVFMRTIRMEREATHIRRSSKNIYKKNK